MRKLYFVLLLLCVVSTASFAQVTTRVLYASGAPSSGRTGSSTATVLTEGTMETSGGGPLASRSWAVFDLSSIPSDAVITSVVIGFNVESIIPGIPGTYNICGYPGDISTLGTAAATYPAMVPPTSTSLSTTPFGTVTGTKVIASSGASVAFVQAHVGGSISVTFSTTSTRIWTFSNETGILDTGGAHAPYLMIKWTCPGVTITGASSTPASVCPGALAILTGGATGATGYSWTGPGGTLSTTTTATDNPTAQTTYTFAATSSSGTGCKTERLVTVSVNPVPSAATASSGPTAICAGSTVDLFPSTLGTGDIYQWFESGTPVSGATNSTYTASATGSYAVQITNTSGCSATSTGVPVLVLDTPTLTPTGLVNVCSSGSGSALLTVNTGGVTSGLTYQWKKDGVVIPGATNSTYSATATGNYTAEVATSGGGCIVNTTATMVNIASYPNPPVNYNGSVVSTSSTYINYQWYLNSVAITGATSFNYIPTTNGTYRVRVTTTAGCINYSAPLAIGNVGVTDRNVENISIYPNPATNIVLVDAAFNVSAVVTTVDGRTLIDQNNVKEINIANLPNGVYLIRIHDERGMLVVKKLVKE